MRVRNRLEEVTVEKTGGGGRRTYVKLSTKNIKKNKNVMFIKEAYQI